MGSPLSHAERQRRYRHRHPDYREREVVRCRRRVYVGQYYVGIAPTIEIAQRLNDETRREFHDRKNQSRA